MDLSKLFHKEDFDMTFVEFDADHEDPEINKAFSELLFLSKVKTPVFQTGSFQPAGLTVHSTDGVPSRRSHEDLDPVPLRVGHEVPL